jgi:hypothetical protein
MLQPATQSRQTKHEQPRIEALPSGKVVTSLPVAGWEQGVPPPRLQLDSGTLSTSSEELMRLVRSSGGGGRSFADDGR